MSLIAVAGDEKSLVLTCKTKAARYSLPGLKELNHFEIGECAGCVLSPDGGRMAVLSVIRKPAEEGFAYDLPKRVVLFDTATGRETGNLDGLCPDNIASTAFHPLQDRIAVQGYNTATKQIELRLIDLKSRKVLVRRETGLQGGMEFSQDGRRLLLVEANLKAMLLDSETLRELTPLVGSGEIFSVGFAPDGSLAVSPLNSGILRFDGAGRRITGPVDRNRHLMRLDFTAGGGTILAAGQFDFKLHWIDARTGATLRSFAIPDAPVYTLQDHLTQVAFSPDGKRVVYGLTRRLPDAHHKYELCEVTIGENGKASHRVLHSHSVGNPLWSTHPYRDWLVDPPREADLGTAKVSKNDDMKRLLPAPVDGEHSSLQFNRTGTLAAGIFCGKKTDFGYEPSRMNVYAMPEGRLLHSFPNRDRNAVSAFTQDNRFLIVCDTDGFRVYELSTGGMVLQQRVELGIPVYHFRYFATCHAVAPDGKTFATGHTDGNIYVWDLLRIDGKPPTKPGDGETAGLLLSLASKNAKEAHAAGCRLMLLGDGVIPELLKSMKPDATALHRDRARLLLERIGTPTAREALMAIREGE